MCSHAARPTSSSVSQRASATASEAGRAAAFTDRARCEARSRGPARRRAQRPRRDGGRRDRTARPRAPRARARASGGLPSGAASAEDGTDAGLVVAQPRPRLASASAPSSRRLRSITGSPTAARERMVASARPPSSDHTTAHSPGTTSRRPPSSSRVTARGVRAEPSRATSASSWRICSNPRRVRAFIVGERRATRRSLAIVIRSLPSRFASYSAASAACISVRRSEPSSGERATPKLRVSRQPPRSSVSSVRCRRRQTVRAFGRLVDGRSSANSSPPSGRRSRPGACHGAGRPRPQRSASSPATWPRRSFSSLKSSRSASTRANSTSGAASISASDVSWKRRWFQRPVSASVTAARSERSSMRERRERGRGRARRAARPARTRRRRISTGTRELATMKPSSSSPARIGMPMISQRPSSETPGGELVVRSSRAQAERLVPRKRARGR